MGEGGGGAIWPSPWQATSAWHHCEVAGSERRVATMEYGRLGLLHTYRYVFRKHPSDPTTLKNIRLAQYR
jgi:hypothetical protein